MLSTIFTYAKNKGTFDGANPVDGVLIPMHAREPGQTHAYDLGQVLENPRSPPASRKKPGRDGGLRGVANYHLAHSARAELCRRLGRLAEASASYEKALALAWQESDRRFLAGRLQELK